MVSDDLIARIREQYALSWNGIHGFPHWTRVLENGCRLSALTPGSSIRVAELFAFLHDSCRLSDAHDPDHGPRAAGFIRTLPSSILSLEPEELEHLVSACEEHTMGLVEAHPAVQVCWDADRLDLGRVGYRLAPHLLCTKAARDPAIMAWANVRSSEHSPARLRTFVR